MIREFDTIVLDKDIAEHNLRRGDVGAVVHCYKDGQTFEVEFVTGEGETLALITLTGLDIRPMQSKEILHVRELSLA